MGDKMKNITLYVPKLEDYWYEQKVQSDPLSMSYNAGYDVSYYGYHYDTGCIDFPKDRWEITFNKRIKENTYYGGIHGIHCKETGKNRRDGAPRRAAVSDRNAYAYLGNASDYRYDGSGRLPCGRGLGRCDF